MRYEQLITLAERLIKTFDPVIMTPDSHCDEFLKREAKKLFDTEQTFLRQVFAGVVRYEEFLRVLTNALFNLLPGSTNRNDATLYFIFGYIIIFRLDELPLQEFKKMVNEQNPVKMNVFMGFLFDVKKLDQYVKPGWIEIYDPDFIQDKVIGGIEGHLPMMRDLLGSISAKATQTKSELVASLEESDEETEQKKSMENTKRAPTKQQPFNLTQPKLKEIPEPIVIPKVIKSNPVPKNLNKVSLKQLEEEKQKRLEEQKQQIQKSYQQSKQQPFDFKTEKRPNNIEKVRKEVEEEVQKELQFNKKVARPVPDFSEPAEIKLNAAAILREEILLQKKQEQERKRIQDLETNMRDSGEFEEWQNQQREKDELAQLEHQQRKKVEMELAREAAIRAQEDKFNENKQLVEQMKIEQLERQKEREELQKEQVEHRRRLIEQVAEDAKLVAIEKEKVIERNRKQAEEAKIEMAKLIERKKLEEEQLKQKRKELINQIRELEKQPRKRTKGYDPTETMGYGLLEEMSLAELRERLDQVKAEQKAEEEERRATMIKKKDEYLNSIQKKVVDIKQYREETHKLKEMEREQKRLKKIKEEQLKREVREQQLLEVQQKIKDKKSKKQLEEEKIAREVKETKLKQQYMNANKAMVEEKAWKSQQDGLEREIKDRQNEKLVNQERIESINNKERTILANAAKTLVEAKVNFNKDYDKSLKTAIIANEKLHSEELENKTRNYQDARQWELEHTKNMVERDQFKSKLAQQSLENSKKQSMSAAKRATSAKARLPSAQYPNK